MYESAAIRSIRAQSANDLGTAEELYRFSKPLSEKVMVSASRVLRGTGHFEYNRSCHPGPTGPCPGPASAPDKDENFVDTRVIPLCSVLFSARS